MLKFLPQILSAWETKNVSRHWRIFSWRLNEITLELHSFSSFHFFFSEHVRLNVLLIPKSKKICWKIVHKRFSNYFHTLNFKDGEISIRLIKFYCLLFKKDIWRTILKLISICEWIIYLEKRWINPRRVFF